MNSKIELVVQGRKCPVKQFVFSGGEVSVKIIDTEVIKKNNVMVIFADIRDSDGIMMTLMLKDAIKNINSSARIYLNMDYTPYARQDRVCDDGESFSLRVFADIINNAGFEAVNVVDPHSDVVPALIDNCFTVSMETAMNTFANNVDNKLMEFINQSEFLSPDAGANKKMLKVLRMFGKDSFIRADKIRDVSTGMIIESVVFGDVPERVLIVDDICDGGRTFIEIAEVLRKSGAKEIGLYVTHGIFSKGKKVLYDNGINHIWAYNDWTMTKPKEV